MSMNSPHESVKDLVGHVWKTNKPLLFVFLAGIAIVLYIVWKKNSGALIAPTSTPAPTANGTPVSITYGAITNITKTITQSGGPPNIPTPILPAPKTQLATVRSRQTAGSDKLWDAGHSGVPVRSQPTGSASVVRILPFGSTIVLLQAKLTAAANQQGGSNQWYPVTGGYLSAWDIASIQ